MIDWVFAVLTVVATAVALFVLVCGGLLGLLVVVDSLRHQPRRTG